MRRFLLTLTALSVSARSQPAQQPAQPPIVVQVQMPPETIWTTLLKLAIPTLLGAGLGAGLTLYGVRLTNKHNAAENAANRRHQLQVETSKAELAAKYRSQDNRWDFRKDVYVHLIKTSHDILRSFHNLAHAAKLKTDPQEARRKLAMATVEAERPHLTASINEFTTYAALAPLATADDVLPLLAAASKQVFREVNFDSPDAAAEIQEQMKPLFALLNRLQAAGRKDLWETLEPDAKTEATKQDGGGSIQE